MTRDKDKKSQVAATKYFDNHEHTQEVAVVLGVDGGTWISIYRKNAGQLLSVDYPSTYENLEYAAQCLLRRFDVHRAEVVYADA